MRFSEATVIKTVKVIVLLSWYLTVDAKEFCAYWWRLEERNAVTALLVCRAHHCIYAELHWEKKVSNNFKEAWSQQGMNMAVLFLDSCQCISRMLMHRETLLTSISMSTGIFAPLHCKCWHALTFKEWVIRDFRCEALWKRGFGEFFGVLVNTVRWFFLTIFKCTVTKEKSTFLFLQQCKLTLGTNTKLGLLLFKLL